MPAFDYEIVLSGGARLRVTKPVALQMMKHIQDPDPSAAALTVLVQDDDGTQKGAVISSNAIIAVLASEAAIHDAASQA